MSQSSARRAKTCASQLLGLLLPVMGVVASCGGNARSARQDGNAGAPPSAGSLGRAGAHPDAGGGTRNPAAGASSGDSGSTVMGGTSTGGAATSGTGTGGTGTSGTEAEGGAAGTSTAGAGGESACVDVCGLHGPSCCVPSVPCVAEDTRCVIEIFQQMVSINYQYAELEATVALLPLAFLASLSTADIESTASDAPATARFEMRLSPAASALHGAALENAVLHPFRVSCDGQSLFVGQVYSMIGAAAFQTPVLYVSRDADDSILLRLNAWQGGWGASTSPSTLPARERLDRPELRATLCLSGPIQSL